jgi:hypothetical protein
MNAKTNYDVHTRLKTAIDAEYDGKAFRMRARLEDYTRPVVTGVCSAIQAQMNGDS